ncbi:MBL fold metallo-hydrolase [Chelatococcus sp. GCM10030263]|uniref:MBL fold metallo-hydrolase n=1 Tax=Chelatococcus sp. GCM10030263 TaxID=3273387 RepID=UPI0036121743
MIKLGDFEISRVEEVVLDEPTSLFTPWTEEVLAEHRHWMAPNFYNEDRQVLFSTIQTWILKTPERTIVIDTSGGNDKDRPLSPRFHKLATDFPKKLRAAGVDPETVDMVILTHLHVDHVGWNTRLDGDNWVPMFPKADYVVSATELEVRDPKRGAAARPPGSWNTYNDSVLPILEAGLARIVGGTEMLLPGVELVPIPGHAPGQMGVKARSGGQEALFIADVMHSPIQIYHPDWNSKFCENQDLARETRAKVLGYAAETGALILPGHFGWPYCGYVRRAGDGYAFEPSPVVP